MFFLNLTGPELFALFAALGTFVSALYLLDRARARKVVSTLQFWVASGATDLQQRRRRVREPWSLLLQLLSLLLLLLAVAGIEWGGRAGRWRAHVLLIDTSSWAAARSAASAEKAVLDSEKQQALQYLAALPASDAVMLVAAGSLAEPLTAFTSDRTALRSALARLSAGYGVLDANAVLAFAAQARNWSLGSPGEILYIGPRMVERLPIAAHAPTRVLPVPANRENCGILRFTAELRENEFNTWQALVQLKNYGTRARAVQLKLRFERTWFSPRHVVIPPGGEASAEYIFTTQSPGLLTASIDPGDSLALDDRASLSLPSSSAVRVAVYTSRPELFRPLVASDHQLQPVFFAPTAYNSQSAADLVILDGFAPATRPRVPTLWINPPKEHAPLPVKSLAADTSMTWNGVQAKAVHLPAANVFETFAGDQALASTLDGPVVVLRAAAHDRPASAVVGFDPLSGPLRFDLATPLLFATLIDKLSPVAFRERLYGAQQVGLARVALDRDEPGARVEVVDEHGARLPFTQRAGELEVFVPHPATVRITSGRKERILDLRLPAVAEQDWSTPQVAQGMPPLVESSSSTPDLWRWLACSAALLLLIEWYLFGVSRARARQIPDRYRNPERKPERELAVK